MSKKATNTDNPIVKINDELFAGLPIAKIIDVDGNQVDMMISKDNDRIKPEKRKKRQAKKKVKTTVIAKNDAKKKERETIKKDKKPVVKSPEQKENDYNSEALKIIKKMVKFLSPLEETYTGTGLPALFSWLACRTGAGVIVTSPMGAGKTLLVKLVDQLMSPKVSGIAHHCIELMEFKKTDWIEIFPQSSQNEVFHLSIPEISAMPKYSQEYFWSRIPPFQTEGDFKYVYAGDGKPGAEGSIDITGATCSYIIASQPAKTFAIINDTTFKTLANDRCWNLILINQLRGRKNIHVKTVEEVIAKLKLSTGEFTSIVRKRNSKWKFLPEQYRFTKEVKGKAIEFVKFGSGWVKFTAGGSDKYKAGSDHVGGSDLDLGLLEDCIRNQYSVARREEQMTSILKEWGVFLDVELIKQVHVDMFINLFGFYINLFNSLTVGSVEQSISIKYGAVEMLCRISDLIGKGRLVTRSLLCKEFNAGKEDVSFHLNELVNASVLKKRVITTESTAEKTGKKAPGRPKKKAGEKSKAKDRKGDLPRSQAGKSDKQVGRSTNVLLTVGLIAKRRATSLDQAKDSRVKIKETIYEFEKGINDFFTFYATILSQFLPKKVLKGINQIEKFVPAMVE